MPPVRRERRHTRGRPDRGGRAHPRAGRRSRRRCPRAAAPTAASRPPAVCAAARSTRSSGAGCTRRSAGRSPRPRCTTACGCPQDDPRRRAPVARKPAVRGSVAVAHHAAWLAARRGRPQLRARDGRLALFEMGTLFVLDGDERAGEAPPRRCASSARLWPCCSAARISAATWGAPDPPRADLFAVKGVLEALGAALRVASSSAVRARSRSCTRAAPPRCCATVQELGWLGELHPLVAREWDIDGAAVMELRARPAARDRRGAERLSRRDLLSGAAPGPGGGARRGGRGRAGA